MTTPAHESRLRGYEAVLGPVTRRFESPPESFTRADGTAVELPEVHVYAFERDFSTVEGESKPGWVLVTSGMSDQPMTLDAAAQKRFDAKEIRRRVELVWYVQEPTDEQVEHLQYLVRLPFAVGSWLGFGHTIDSGYPILLDSHLSATLLLDLPAERWPMTRAENAMFDEFRIDGDEVGVLVVHLLTPDEYAFTRSNDAHAIQKRLEQSAHYDLPLDETRVSVLKLDEKGAAWAPVGRILAQLDEGAREGEAWPIFFCQQPDRAYHAMRLTVVKSRSSDAWALVFEVLEGSSPPRLQVNRYRHDSDGESGLLRGIGAVDLEATPQDLDLDDATGVPLEECYASGPEGMVELNGELIASLEPRRATTRPLDDMRWTLLVRAYLARYPDAFWANDDEMLDLSLVDDGEILLATTAFEHVIGPHDADVDPDGVDRQWARLPSQSAIYESLAAAIVAGDASRFEPGESNLDWRQHLPPAENADT